MALNLQGLAQREFSSAEEFDREGKSRRKMLYGLIFAVLAAVALGYYYYQNIYKPEQERKPYKQAGLTDEQAESFIKAHPQQNGNSTWIDFAKRWVEDASLAERICLLINFLKEVGNPNIPGISLIMRFLKYGF